MQEGVESIGKCVVAGCDTAKLPEAIEESLDEVSCLVVAPIGFAVASRWDDRFSTGGLDDVDQGIALVTFDGNDCSGSDGLNHGLPLRDISDLAGVRIR